MPIPIQWRAKQTSSTTGAGTLVLSVADARFRTFLSALGGAGRVHYQIELPGTSEWEEGIGTFDGANPGTLTRVTVLANYLGNTSLVTFAAGVKDVLLLGVPGHRRQVDFSASVTASLSDLGCILNCTADTARALTLPAAATVPLGTGYLVRNSGTLGAALTVDGSGAELVGAELVQVLFPGDSMEIWCNGAGWNTSGLPGLSLIETRNVTGTPGAVDFALPAAGAYQIHWTNLNFSTDALLMMRISRDAGATYDAGASDYSRTAAWLNGSAWVVGASAGDAIFLTNTTSASSWRNSGRLDFSTGTASVEARVTGGASDFALPSAGTLVNGVFGGGRTVTGAANAIRLLPSAGTFVAGGAVSIYHRRA